MKNNVQYKEQAKSLMTGKYGSVIVSILITGLITGIPSQLADRYNTKYEFDFEIGKWVMIQAGNQSLSSLFSILAFILGALVAYGLTLLYIETANNREFSVEKVLKSGFTDQPLRTVLHAFIVNIFTVLWTLLLIIPGIMAAYKYSMGYFLLQKDPALSAFDAVGKSKEYMMGHRGQLFLLDLSYLGWYILGLFTLGILWFWILPKHQTARTLFFIDRYLEVNPEPVVVAADPFAIAE